MAEYRLIGTLEQYPARFAALAYFAVALVGTLLLLTPWARQEGVPAIEPVDALFTATSALCVTGLVVRSTGNDFSFFGQVVILILIQLGGIGIVTVTTFVALRFTGADTLRQRVAAAEAVGGTPGAHLPSLLLRVFVTVLVFEAVGATLLGLHSLVSSKPGEGWWPAVFHSVSAFCNAGFSLYDDSLVRFRGDVWYSGTIMLLIVTGGIGFPVLADLGRAVVRWRRGEAGHLTLHTKLMLTGTAVLIVLGTVVFLLLEWGNTLARDSLPTKVFASLFQAVTCRTAGFNTIPTGELTSASLWVSMILMSIGAGPCSTAGGFKVSTFMALVLLAWRRLQGEPRVFAFRRGIDEATVSKAVSTALLFAVSGMAFLTGVLVVQSAYQSPAEQHMFFLDAFFETISALGTVGLSTGITPELSTGAKLVLIMAMFMGRLGPMSFFIALSRRLQRAALEYPPEPVYIG